MKIEYFNFVKEDLKEYYGVDVTEENIKSIIKQLADVRLKEREANHENLIDCSAMRLCSFDAYDYENGALIHCYDRPWGAGDSWSSAYLDIYVIGDSISLIHYAFKNDTNMEEYESKRDELLQQLGKKLDNESTREGAIQTLNNAILSDIQIEGLPVNAYLSEHHKTK